VSVRRKAISLGFSAFSLGGLHRLAPRAIRGLGVILTLHRVRPFAPALPGYAPNALLEITPDFLDAALRRLKSLGFELVTLREAARRLDTPGKRFAALTFDDGYLDFRDHALPVLERHGAPATLFLCPGFIEGGARLWWLELEEAIRRLDQVSIEEGPVALPTRDAAEKAAAFERVYWRLRAEPEARLLAATAKLAAEAGVTEARLRKNLFLGWDDLAALAAHPLVTFGAHSLTHIRLAQWPEEIARSELAGSKAALEQRFDRPIESFCYPVGDPTSAGPREFALARDSGYAIGVTTRPGLLFPEHAAHRLALPRVSLNGHWQSLASLDALLSGAPFFLWNRGRRVNVG
jgi:peptidoglycan/xylan/chitin deacetylase (PgdA/CDA1 family)